MVFGTQPAKALEWSAQPSLHLGYEHNNNPRLTLESHNTVNGTIVSPSLDLNVASESWKITGNAEASRKHYSGESDLDRDEHTLSLSSVYQSERNSWQLSGSQTHDSVLSQQIGPDFGIAQTQIQRETNTVSPAWTWFMTETTQVQFAYQASGVAYENGLSAGLYDYSYRTGSATLTKAMSPRSQVFWSGAYSIYRAPSFALEQKTSSAQIGVASDLSETLHLSLSAGGRKTTSQQAIAICTVPNPFFPFFGPACFQTENVAFNTKDSGVVYNAELRKKLDTVGAKISLSRAIDPTGTGGQVQTDRLDMSIGKPFSARLRGSFYAYVYDVRTVAGSVTNTDRRIYGAQPKVWWEWTSSSELSLAYAYTHLKRQEETRAVSSSAIYLDLNYTWQKMAISR